MLEQEKKENNNFFEITIRGPKRYYFQRFSEPQISINDTVIFELDRGFEIGKITMTGTLLRLKNPSVSQKKIVRKATDEDMANDQENRIKEADAVKLCKQKIVEHNMPMKLVDVEYQFDRSKITFYFIAEQRIDFRVLVKDLANTYKTRIELMQIGVRDQAKRLGGLGICGLPLCCTRHVKEFDHITTQMARDQNLAPTPTKLSGNCCRLKCCLKYELDIYQETMKDMPAIGAFVDTQYGKAEVLGCNIFTKKLHLKKEDNSEVIVHVTEATW